MQIVTMKHHATLRVINQAALASGTASGIWSGEPDAQEAKEAAMHGAQSKNHKDH